MDENQTKGLPAWVWRLAFAASQASLDYDPKKVPDDLAQAWERCLEDVPGQHEVVLGLLTSCKPEAAHHFLHGVGAFDELTEHFAVVLARPDCDRATALMYFAYFWQNYHDGERQWMEDAQHELIVRIRERAWRGGYGPRRFDVPEGALHELPEMRRVLVENAGHPFALPASFLAMSRKEEMFHKLRERLMPRRGPSH